MNNRDCCAQTWRKEYKAAGAAYITPVTLAHELLEEGVGIADARCADERGVCGEAVAPVGADAALGGALDRKKKFCDAAPQRA